MPAAPITRFIWPHVLSPLAIWREVHVCTQMAVRLISGDEKVKLAAWFPSLRARARSCFRRGTNSQTQPPPFTEPDFFRPPLRTPISVRHPLTLHTPSSTHLRLTAPGGKQTTAERDGPWQLLYGVLEAVRRRVTLYSSSAALPSLRC